MLAIPNNVLARFNEFLKQRAVHESSHIYYRKWLRYFLDFCEKYPPPDTKSEQVRLFAEKLKSKKQTPQPCSQAAHAVSLFFELQQPKNCPPSASLEGRNLPSARPANPPAKALVTKSAGTGGIGLQAMPTVAVAEPSPSFDPLGGKRYNKWRCFMAAVFVFSSVSAFECRISILKMEY